MRIALISDIHANLIALESSVKDITSQNVDHIICLGDVAASGPQPVETIKLLQEMNSQVVMGNMDAWLLDPPSFHEDEKEYRKIAEINYWCAEQLSEVELDYIKTFHSVLELEIGGISLCCFHGSPSSQEDLIKSDTPIEDIEKMITGFDSAVYAGGHTHAQMLRRYVESSLINPGSVGLAFRNTSGGYRNVPWSEYALLEINNGILGIEFRRVLYDIKKLKEVSMDIRMPHSEWWSGNWD